MPSIPKTHPLVKSTKDNLSKNDLNRYGFYSIRKDLCLDIKVSPQSLKRALKIWFIRN